MNNISLVFITDSNYILPTWVATRSAIESKEAETALTIFLIADRLSQDDKNHMKTLSEGIKNVEIQFIDVDSTTDFKDKFTADNLKSWSPAVMYKFMLPELLPKDLKRVIWLDGDMIIRKDLGELYETDLEGNLLGAVRDTFYDNIAHEKRMNLPGKYINTGCMLLDLDEMRKERIAEKLIDTKNKRPDLGIADQDTFNEVCRNRIKLLSCRYNFYLTSFLMNEDMEGFKKYTVCPYDSRKKMIDDIAVIHMIHYRPWKLNLSTDEIKKIACAEVSSIWESAMGYILLEWLRIFNESPFAIEGGYKLLSQGAEPTLTDHGLLSHEKKGIFEFSITQDCRSGNLCVSYLMGKIPLITKETDVVNKKKFYKLF